MVPLRRLNVNRLLTLYNIINTNSSHAADRTVREIFRFMDLPGEIRNRIYEKAIEVEMPRMVRFCHDPKGAAPRLSSSPDYLFSLTQVCSQARREFRPTWFEGRKSRVTFSDGVPWLQTFMSNGSDKTSHNYSGSLLLAEAGPTSIFDEYLFDLLPFLRFQAASPNFKIYAYARKVPLIRAANIIFRTFRKPNFKKLLDGGDINKVQAEVLAKRPGKPVAIHLGLSKELSALGLPLKEDFDIPDEVTEAVIQVQVEFKALVETIRIEFTDSV